MIYNDGVELKYHLNSGGRMVASIYTDEQVEALIDEILSQAKPEQLYVVRWRRFMHVEHDTKPLTYEDAMRVIAALSTNGIACEIREYS